MRNSAEKVKLFNGDTVNFVDHIDAWHINSISFNHINQLIHGAIALENDLSIRNTVLVENRAHSVLSHVLHLESVSPRNGDTSLVFPLKNQVWLLLVQSDSKALKLTLNNPLVSEGLLSVQDNENECAGATHSNDLLTTTLTVFGSLNNTWQIEQLDLGSLVIVDSRDAGERCELVVSGFRELACQFGQQG